MRYEMRMSRFSITNPLLYVEDDILDIILLYGLFIAAVG